MTSLRSEDSGLGVGEKDIRRPSAVSFSHTEGEGFALTSNNNDNNNNSSPDNNNHDVPMSNSSNNANNAGGNSPGRSRRAIIREIIAAVRSNREVLVDSFIRTAASYRVKQLKWQQDQEDDKNSSQLLNNTNGHNSGDADEYPIWVPSFYTAPEQCISPQRIVTVNKPNTMRNRALAAMAMALSTLTLEMQEGTPLSGGNKNNAAANPFAAAVALPAALEASPKAGAKGQSSPLADTPTSPVIPSDEQHPNRPTRELAPVTVEDIAIQAKVPLDILSQPMLTLFEAQDIFQKCISASPVLNGKFEVKIAQASVLLVDTEDDWGTGFEVAPRRLAYKASELEEALSDVLRRRGVAICFFDKKALLEGMKQDDVGGEDDDDEDGSHQKNMNALLNAPLNDDGGFHDDGAAASSGALFNGSFTGMGANGRGVPIAMQALRTRRTDIREADCGFVLGPTRQAESVALAVTQWNRERDELELVYAEVTATALLDAMAMRNVKTGRPRGFVALMPLQDLSISLPGGSNGQSPSGGSAGNSPGQSQAQSPQDVSIMNQSNSNAGGPNISALEIVSSSAVTLDCVFPAFATLAQYHADEIDQNAIMSNKSLSRIPLGHIDRNIATHLTCTAIGAAAIGGTLAKGLPINDIVNSVNMSDVHMCVESDSTLHVHEVFSYILQYSLKNPAAELDVEWCPVVQLVHRANAAATVSVEQLCSTLSQVRSASCDDQTKEQDSLKKPLNVVMLVKVRIDIAAGTHGNSLNGAGGGTRWLVVCGYEENSATVHVLDPAPKRFGLFWSVSVEQLHRALTNHGYIILSNKHNTVGKTASDYMVSRPETSQICLQAGISYDSPDSVLPPHSQLPPRAIARCPLSLAACAISRISGKNFTFSQFLRSLPHPTPYGFTEEISLAHFAHFTRTFCHGENLRVKMTLCHLSVDAHGTRAVDEIEFSQRLASAAASPRHAVIVNYNVGGFSNCVRSDHGTGSFALLLGFIPQDGRLNRYDRVLLQDCSDYSSEQVFSVEVTELYRACCDVCSVSRRTMGFIDLRFVGEEEHLSPVASLQSIPSALIENSASNKTSTGSINREQNVSIALEGTLATADWDTIAIAYHPELPRHMFKSPAIPVFTATSSAFVSLGITCGESDIIGANFGESAATTQYEYLPTVLQAKPPTLATARNMIDTYIRKHQSNQVSLLSAEKTNLFSALEAMSKFPNDVRIILQYDCRVVHSTIRKFVSAGVVSAVKGAGEDALIRVLEAETASFLDVWEAKAGSLLRSFDEASEDRAQATGVFVIYRKGSAVTEAMLCEEVSGNNKRPSNLTVRRTSSPVVGAGSSLIMSPPASPLGNVRGGNNNNNNPPPAPGAARSKAMPYSLGAPAKKASP